VPSRPDGAGAVSRARRTSGIGTAGNTTVAPMGHDHHHGVAPDADRRRLAIALSILLVFAAGEVVAGLLAGSVALLADAGHVVSDAAARGLSIVAIVLAARPPAGSMTYGLKRAEPASALLNGGALGVLAIVFTIQAVVRLIDPADVDAVPVLVVALVGIPVNLLATWVMAGADRSSVNVEGAYQHVVTDLYAFVGTAIAAVVILATGFDRADPIAALFVAALMARAALGLLRATARIFFEAAPEGVDVTEVGRALAGDPGVAEVHDLHVWELTSGYSSLSAHVFVRPEGDCNAVRRRLQGLLARCYGITHTTLQVDPAPDGAGGESECVDAGHCTDPHGPHYLSPRGGQPASPRDAKGNRGDEGRRVGGSELTAQGPENTG
jgi:cobalt-zinc-cadmium efflux system protein